MMDVIDSFYDNARVAIVDQQTKKTRPGLILPHTAMRRTTGERRIRFEDWLLTFYFVRGSKK
jgi:hypothetical protein